MPAAPQVGDVLRQEVMLGVAEDFARTVDTAGNESVAAGFACNHQCLVSEEGTPLEPGVFELKHFAPGVGLLLEVDMEGNRLELFEFDAL